MSRIKLDLSQFQHVDSDDKSTTLKHKQGHTLTIAHKSLSKEAKAQLDALSSMGKKDKESKDVGYGKTIVKEDKEQPIGKVKVIEDDEKKPMGKTIVKEDKEQPIGKVQMLAQGDEVLPQKAINMSVNPDMVPPITQNIAPMDPASPAPVDEDTQMTRKLYNDMVKKDSWILPQNMAFGENGEAPGQFSPEMWGKAKATKAEFDATKAKEQADQVAKISEQNKARMSAGLPPLPGGETPQQPEVAPQMPTEAEIDAAAKGIAPAQLGETPKKPGMDMSDPASRVQGGLEQEMRGIYGASNAQQMKANEETAALAKDYEAKDQAKNYYMSEYQGLKKQYDQFSKDVQDGQIDPEKYWTGVKQPDGTYKGGHSKALSIIGMIIGGFSPVAGPNGGVDMLKMLMDQNLDAQTKNLASKQNLLAYNIQQFGNLKNAMDMTRVQQNEIVMNMLQQAASRSANPMAKATADQLIGKLKQQNAFTLPKIAMQQAMMKLSSNPNGNPKEIEHMLGYMDQLDPEKAKMYRERYVPGIGMSTSGPVPQEIRGKLIAHQEMDKSVKDLQKFVKENTTLIPGTPAYNIGAQKALALQSSVREGMLGTVYKEGEQPLLDKFVNSNPAGMFKMLKTIPQLSELLNHNTRSMNLLKANYGLPVTQAKEVTPEQQQQAALAWAKANPKDPRAAKILNLAGK